MAISSRARHAGPVTPPTVHALWKHDGLYAIVPHCCYCGGRHFVRPEPGLQPANCEMWNPRAKAGYVVVFDEERPAVSAKGRRGAH